MRMASSRDLHSTGLSWALVVAGIVLTTVAAESCHKSQLSASSFQVAAALVTVQLLGFTAASFSYRFWLVTSISDSSRHAGPSAQEPRLRRGLPSLKSPGGVAGLDGWSLLVISLVALPVLVPLLMHHAPNLHYNWKRAPSNSSQSLPLGITGDRDFNRNGATYYTVAAYEAVRLSLEAVVPGAGDIAMSNTADVAIDSSNKRVLLPSRVYPACKHEHVTAKKLKALVGTYACTGEITANSIGMPLKNVCDSDASSANGGGSDLACVELRNSTANVPTPVQFMTVQHSDYLVHCSATFSVATVDVTWQGQDLGPTRMCRITNITVHEGFPEDRTYPLTAEDLTGNKSMEHLKLPLTNAFQHTVDRMRVQRSDKAAVEKFYGSIFAAALGIRAVGYTFDPTKGGGYVEVHYSSSVCMRYNWSSGVSVFLLVANIILATACTILSSGATAGSMMGTVHIWLSLCCCHCCRCCQQPAQLEAPAEGPQA